MAEMRSDGGQPIRRQTLNKKYNIERQIQNKPVSNSAKSAPNKSKYCRIVDEKKIVPLPFFGIWFVFLCLEYVLFDGFMENNSSSSLIYNSAQRN